VALKDIGNAEINGIVMVYHLSKDRDDILALATATIYLKL
jgi:hypothetical protein